jgi:hypothetical protein
MERKKDFKASGEEGLIGKGERRSAVLARTKGSRIISWKRG